MKYIAKKLTKALVTTVVFSKRDKINEGQIHLNSKDHYMHLEQQMVVEKNHKVIQLINELYRKNHLDEMTKNGFVKHQFYTLTKIHKPVRTGRPIISGWEGIYILLGVVIEGCESCEGHGSC